MALLVDMVAAPFLIDLPWSSLLACSRKSVESTFSAEAIGVRTFQYVDSARNRPVVVEFWYPTDDRDSPCEATEDSVWVHPREVRDVALSAKSSSYPLIIMSHGHRGDRRETTWLVDSLVRQGFVVASVEHYGTSWHQYNPLSAVCFWDRAKDISFALSRLLENEELKGRIDEHRIGFVGYSMGGMTGLALAGAVAKDAKQIALSQKNQAGNIPDEYLEMIDFSEAEKDYREPRIHSFLLICPATFAYSAEAIKQIKATVGLIASVDDEVLPHKEHANKIIQHLHLRKIKILKNKTSHYAFLNHMTKKGIQILKKSSTATPLNWTPIHKEATEFAIKFFKETLPEEKK